MPSDPRSKDFFRVGNHVFHLLALKEIDAQAFTVLAYLISCARQRDTCYPNQKTIAEYTGLAKRTVSNKLDLLEEKGLICRDRKRRGGMCHYRLCYEEIWGQNCNWCISTSADNATVEK